MSYQPTADQDERTLPQSEVWRRFLKQFGCDLRVAEPGIVVSFDPGGPSVTVQLAVMERIIQQGAVQTVQIPPLPEVPIVLPRAGGWSLTMPIVPGDECLVVFADMSIEDWIQSGGVVNQIGNRRHNLNDGFAIFGTQSKPRALANYSTTSTQLRSDDGATVIDLAPGEIKLTAATIALNGGLSLLGPVVTNPVSGFQSVEVSVAGVPLYLRLYPTPP